MRLETVRGVYLWDDRSQNKLLRDNLLQDDLLWHNLLWDKLPWDSSI